MPIITLLTDFGTADYFVGAMKGVILGIAPGATLVDVTHDVPPQDVRAGAFTLLAAYGAFPAGTVHVAVVDPGVGSARRGIVMEAGGHRFVGPDNGLFAWIAEREGAARAFHLADPSFFRQPVSSTFHGRDIFAPAAAALANGVAPSALGPEVTGWVRLGPLAPTRGPDGVLTGSILHADRFGNCVTSFTRADLPPDADARGIVLRVNGREIRRLRRFYADAGGDGDDAEPFTIWGSAGFLEISVNRASAAHALNVAPGAPVTLRIG